MGALVVATFFGFCTEDETGLLGTSVFNGTELLDTPKDVFVIVLDEEEEGKFLDPVAAGTFLVSMNDDLIVAAGFGFTEG